MKHTLRTFIYHSDLADSHYALIFTEKLQVFGENESIGVATFNISVKMSP